MLATLNKGQLFLMKCNTSKTLELNISILSKTFDSAILFPMTDSILELTVIVIQLKEILHIILHKNIVSKGSTLSDIN